MMASSLPHPEHPMAVRPEEADSVQPKSVSLHAVDCTESDQDLQRMRDLLEKDPSLLYSVQPPSAPLTRRNIRGRRPRHGRGYMTRDSFRSRGLPPPPDTRTPPLWHACKAQHLACVKFILEASGPENITRLLNFKYLKENILSYSYFYGTEIKKPEKSYEIIKTLLEHGISPNVEIPMAEIHNPEILQVPGQYKTKTVIFPSSILHMAVHPEDLGVQGGGDPKILKLLLEHGAYPDPVILTESGSILPLYPTLGKHLNPIPAIDHPDIESKSLLHYLTSSIDFWSTFESSLEDFESMKLLLVYGASVPPYSETNQNNKIIFSQMLFLFDLIFKVQSLGDVWGMKPDGTVRRCYDVMLETLKLIHQIGGSLWWKRRALEDEPCEGGKGECVEHARDPTQQPCLNILQFIWLVVEEEPERSMLVEEVWRMMSTPPSLQHSARLAIRRSMGYGCVRNLEALPLHNHLKKYLKFEFETE